MRHAPLLAGALTVLANTGLAAQTSPVTTLADRYVAGIYEFSPEQAVFAGLADAPTDRLSDNSLAALARWQGLEDSLAGALGSIDPKALVGTQDWITYGFLRSALDGGRATRVCRNELWTVNQAFGWQTSLAQLAALQPVGSDSARQAAIRRWSALPRYVRTEITNLRKGMRLGYTASQSVVRAVIGQLDGLLAASSDSLPFLGPTQRDTTPEFVARFRPLVTDSLRAVAREYRTFIAGEYLPKARAQNALSANRDGPACYRALLRQATSLDRDPEALWREVTAVVTRDSAALMRFARDVYRPASGERADIRWLRGKLDHDAANEIPGPDSVRAFTLSAMRRARAALPRWFATVPAGDVTIIPFPEYQQSTAPGGQYIPATD